ncbi:MAG: (d)CMP kinase [Candidatus Zixiibacteriota bacterium]|nr:MAG: (d)CMP kinase [candidate division Zixibacteria bacterium]
MENFQLNLSRLKGKIVAIDGPAGSGKSTTSRMLAARLGYVYLDTGAMYRALTYFSLKNNIDISDETKLEVLAKKLSFEFITENEVNRVFINGEEVTEEIRTMEVTKNVSEVSAHKGVREAMVFKQKEIGKNGSVVAEGRDTTTVVFPKADLKIYLDATVEERAQRRLLELSKKGVSTTLEEQKQDILRRDRYDSNREHSPLQKSKDAIMVDTTNLTIEGQVDHIISLMKSIIN